MALSKWGHVSYADDPHGRVFRIVYPERDDVELDQPPTDANRRPYLKVDGTPHSWTSLGVDTARTAVHNKVAQGTEPKLKGTPYTPSTEPVVYWVNADAVLPTLTDAQLAQMNGWLAANPQWSNNFVSLGNGDAAALTAGLIAPCWIVVIDGGTPSIGTLQRTVTAAGHSVALWIA